MEVRHYCRNQRCRSKLKVPVENKHHAFCCRGCFDTFYLTRCRVCEKDITADPMSGERRKRLAKRLYCGRKCKHEATRYPHVYAWGVQGAAKSSVRSKSADSTGQKSGLKSDRPRHHCLCEWWWGEPVDGDLSLYDKDGLTIARLVLADDGYYLRSPITIPRQAWTSLEQAKRGAESFALMAVPLETVDPKLAARIKRDNETPHPMGPPLNRQLSQESAISSDWSPTGNSSDMPDIPAFLRRLP